MNYAFIVPVSHLSRAQHASPQSLQAAVLTPSNQIFDVLSITAGRAYWLALTHNVRARLFDCFGQEEDPKSLTNKSEESNSGITLNSVIFRQGTYIMKLFVDERTIRTVSVYVHANRKEHPSALCIIGAVHMVILVPENTFWIVQRIHKILTEQHFSTLFERHGKYMYHRQLSASWTIAVLPYDSSASSKWINNVKYASDVLLLLDLPQSRSRKAIEHLQRAFDENGTIMNFTVKSSGCEQLSQSRLTDAQLNVITQLNSFTKSQHLTVSAANVHQGGYNDSEIDMSLREWLSQPSSFDNRHVSMELQFEPESQFFTTETAVQLATEMMPDEYIYDTVIADSSMIKVLVSSCTVYCLWLLTFGEIVAQYPSLLSVEVSRSDLSRSEETFTTVSDMTELENHEVNLNIENGPN